MNTITYFYLLFSQDSSAPLEFFLTRPKLRSNSGKRPIPGIYGTNRVKPAREFRVSEVIPMASILVEVFLLFYARNNHVFAVF